MKTEAPHLPRLKVTRLTGNECFSSNEQSLDIPLIEFWRWSTSDLVSNATRGILAEFIVAMALGLHQGKVREEWRPYDLSYEKLKIEVKSAAYIQSWFQKDYSKIEFSIRPSLSWDPETNTLASEKKRQGDLYVFCLLKYKCEEGKKKEEVDPLNLDQWCFYVVPAAIFNTEKHMNQAKISLASLEKMDFKPKTYSELKAAVDEHGQAPMTPDAQEVSI